jgi:hypothetical protein
MVIFWIIIDKDELFSDLMYNITLNLKDGYFVHLFGFLS